MDDDSHQPAADPFPPPHLRSANSSTDFPIHTLTDTVAATDPSPIRIANGDPMPDDDARVFSLEEEEREVEFLMAVSRANIEMEVYKCKLKEIQDVVIQRSSKSQLDDEDGEKEAFIIDMRNELGICRKQIQELEGEMEDKIRFLEQTSVSTDTVRKSLCRVLRALNEENGDKEGNVHSQDEDMASTLSLTERVIGLVELASGVEREFFEYQEMRKKERRQLESSVVSLTEENRDINTLLRAALVEKEGVERSLSRLKGNTEQKRVPLLQFAERGLHKVGFSFMMASQQTEQLTDSSAASNASSKSDGSEYEEEVVSLVYSH